MRTERLPHPETLTDLQLKQELASLARREGALKAEQLRRSAGGWSAHDGGGQPPHAHEMDMVLRLRDGSLRWAPVGSAIYWPNLREEPSLIDIVAYRSATPAESRAGGIIRAA